MADTLRSKMIRLAASMPKGSSERKALLNVLAYERYEVIESKRWVNKTTGQTASVFGAVPWTRQSEKSQWSMESVGWTVRDNRNGTVGIGRKPWKSRAQAQAWADEENARLSR